MVEEVTKAATAVEEKAAAVTDETTDEDLGKVHEELEKGIADVKSKAEAMIEKCKKEMASITPADTKGPKAEMKKTVNQLTAQCRATEANLQKKTMKVRERYSAIKFEENLKTSETLTEEVESEVKQAIEDSQTLMPASDELEEMEESRVLQVHGLVE